MGKRKFKAELSVKSIENLKKELIHYRDVELPNKCRELATELLKIGVEVSKAKVDESPLGHYVTISTKISSDKVGTKAILIATGEVKKSDEYADFNTLLAIEFGAGIHYNKESINPYANEFGLGVGTFPGQSHALQDEGWYFWDEESQKWKHSSGVKATMPMYFADMGIIVSIIDVARSVFK